MTTANQEALDILFNNARSHSHWLDKPVSDDLLKQAYDLAKMGPTAANCQPLRIVFIKSDEAKERFKPHLDAGNVNKVMTAPVTAIFGMDMEFYEHLAKFFPHTDAKSWYVGNDKLIETTAFRNSTLQAAYFLLAARAVGLDCGPMSGFKNDAVDKEFFAGTKVKSNFICALGYADHSKLFPRGPRPGFADFNKII